VWWNNADENKPKSFKKITEIILIFQSPKSFRKSPIVLGTVLLRFYFSKFMKIDKT
jgi:hypothetical protein